MKKDETPTNIKHYAPVFSDGANKVFFPYDECLFESKSEARKWAKERQRLIWKQLKLLPTGCILQLQAGVDFYPSYRIERRGELAEGEDRTVVVGIISGPALNLAKAAMTNA